MADPSINYWFEVGKIAVPVFLGSLVWSGQALAQRAWTEYERRRDLYLEVVRSVDALSLGNDEQKLRLSRAIRSVWIGGSDEVIKAAQRLIDTTRIRLLAPNQEDAYSELIFEMKQDLQKRRWLPPGKTRLSKESFSVFEISN